MKVDTVARVHGDFHGFELQPLQHLQAGIEGRCLNGHQVARTGHDLQAEIERFQRPIADHQFLDG
ncbi:hypothetical protein D3C84_1134890 [compost metagenome]